MLINEYLSFVLEEVGADCSWNEWQCANGQCIYPRSYRCDNFDDCNDVSDEENCVCYDKFT